jgi:DEAD/DEAH box helicase domain-containing protein
LLNIPQNAHTKSRKQTALVGAAQAPASSASASASAGRAKAATTAAAAQQQHQAPLPDSPTPQPYGSRRVAAIAAAAAADLGVPPPPPPPAAAAPPPPPPLLSAANVDPLGNPGYSSRPNPSPRMGRSTAAALAEAEAAIEAGAVHASRGGGGESGRSTRRSGGGNKRPRALDLGAEATTDDDLVSPATRRLQRRAAAAAAQQQEQAGDDNDGLLPPPTVPLLPPAARAALPSGLSAEEAARLEALPLPPPLQALSRAFAALNAFVAFLQAQNVTPTWRNVREHVGRALPPAPADNAAPTSTTPPITPFEALRALAALAPRVVALSGRDDVLRDLAPELREEYLRGPSVGGGGGFFASAADEAAAGLMTGYGGADSDTNPTRSNEEDELEMTIDLLDPGRRRVDDPPVATRRGRRQQQGSGNDGGGSATTVAKRREAAVRRALAAAALAAHERFLDGLEEEEQGDDDEQVGPPRRWDALARGAWHPRAFDQQQPPLILVAFVEAALEARRQASEALQRQEGGATDEDEAQAGGFLRISGDSEEQEEDAPPPRPRAAAPPPPRPPMLSKRHPPCLDTSTMSPEAFLEHLKALPWYRNQITHVEPLPARPASTCPPRFPLSPGSLAALRWRGLSSGPSSLYSHQARAIDAVLLHHKHVVVATATASGKSLCYSLPLLELLASAPSTTAVLMFPTKALAHDQLRALRGLVGAAFGREEAERWVRTYDGDTPRVGGASGGGEDDDGGGAAPATSERAAVRREARVLLTNPDMLHASLLPHHGLFARFLGGLGLVVVDEGHAYTGVFGTHAALVMRRLRRLVERAYGGGGGGGGASSSSIGPRFVVTSATIANPLGHAAALIGAPAAEIELVDDDGSPCGPKSFVLWNPPLEVEEDEQGGVAAGAGPEAGDDEAEQGAGGASRRRQRGGSTRAAEREVSRWARREELPARRAAVAAAMAAAAAAGGGASAAPDDNEEEEDDSEQGGVAWRARRLVARRARAARECSLELPEGPLDLGHHTAAEQQQPPAPPAAPAALDAPPPAPPRPRYLVQPSSGAAAAGGGDSLPSSPAATLRPPRSAPASGGAADATHQEAERRRRRLLAEQAHAAIAATTMAETMTTTTGGRRGGGGNRGGGAPVAASALRPLPPAEGFSYGGAARDRPLWRVRPGGAALLGRLNGDDNTGNNKNNSADADEAAAQQAIVAALPPRGAFMAAWRANCGSGGGGAAATPAAALPAPTGLVPDARRPASLRGVQGRRGAAGTLEHQARASPIVETARLLAELAQHGLRAIAFCKSRKLCELVATYARDILRASAAAAAEAQGAAGAGAGPHASSFPPPDPSLAFAAPLGDRPSTSSSTTSPAAEALAARVAVYRAGYAPEQRRAIERALHSGSLAAVAATNALELGMDVGDLDVTLHLGFPGSVASLRQQAGRAGRRGQPSLALYVAFDSPLDQQLLRHPRRALFGRPVEAARVDPCNALLLRQHLACAAAEAPLVAADDGPLFGGAGGDVGSGGGGAAAGTTAAVVAAAAGAPSSSSTPPPPPPPSAYAAACASLLAEGLLARHPRLGSGPSAPLAGLHYGGGLEAPSRAVSLRSVDQRRVAVWDESSKRVLEELEFSKAFFHVYDGAVYLHQARTYLCRRLDLCAGVALVHPSDCRYYTRMRDLTLVTVLGASAAYAQSGAGAEMLSSEAAVAAEARGANGLAVSAEVALAALAGRRAAARAGVRAGDGGRGGADDSDSDDLSSPNQLLTTASCEPALVTTRYPGFFRVRHGSGKVFDAVELDLPDIQFETRCAYVRLPPHARLLVEQDASERAEQAARQAREAVARSGGDEHAQEAAAEAARAGALQQGGGFRGAVHAAAHALLHALPLFMVASPSDVCAECDYPYDARYRPERLLLYDAMPGGLGLCAHAAPLFPLLLRRALALVEGCGCRTDPQAEAEGKGCPRCVQHPDCRSYNTVLNKRGAAILLRAVIERERAFAAAEAQRAAAGG